jgi:hypothetical protein
LLETWVQFSTTAAHKHVYGAFRTAFLLSIVLLGVALAGLSAVLAEAELSSPAALTTADSGGATVLATPDEDTPEDPVESAEAPALLETPDVIPPADYYDDEQVEFSEDEAVIALPVEVAAPEVVSPAASDENEPVTTTTAAAEATTTVAGAGQFLLPKFLRST